MSFGAIAAPEVPPYQLQTLIASVFEWYRPESQEHEVATSTTETLLGFSFTKSSPVKDRARAKQDVIVSCVRALGSEIYVGCSDGTLLRFGLQASTPTTPETYQLLSSQKVPVPHGSSNVTSRSIEEIALLPTISRALILCGHYVHFYSLPALDPAPPQLFRPIGGVISLAVDELKLRMPSDQTYQHDPEPVEFCVIKRTSISMYSLHDRLVLQREIGNQGSFFGRRAARVMLTADRDNYNIVDLQGGVSTPLLPHDQSGGGAVESNAKPKVKPTITFLQQSDPIEFLVSTATGVGTAMGVFINGQGDPVRGTLEWPSNPVSLCMDFPHTLALMPNRTIEIHNVETQAIVQVIAPQTPASSPSSSSFSSSPTIPSNRPSSTSPTRSVRSTASSRIASKNPMLEHRHLCSSVSGFLVPSAQGTDKMRLIQVPLIPTLVEEELHESPGSSPERSPRQRWQFVLPPMASTSATAIAGPSQPRRQSTKLPRAYSLVISTSAPEPGQKTVWALQALLPATLVSQAEALLPPQAQRIEEAIYLAEAAERRMLGSVDETELKAEVRYIYQRAGWQRFSETRWANAGDYLLAGDTDPRVLVRYFPDLRGGLLENAPFADIYTGVADSLPKEGSIDDIIAANLVRNYSPHLRPEGTKDARPTAELHRLLFAGAKDMLAAYLRKWRTRRLFASRGSEAKAPRGSVVNSVVDTVLVKLLADTDTGTSELHALIGEQNDVVLSEVEEPLRKNGHYSALCKLHEKTGNVAQLLDVWSKLADGLWVDEDVKDPLKKMVDVLQKSQDRILIQQWALWLTAKDADLGLRLLISKDSRRSVRADEIALLDKVRNANQEAGRKYLEYLVLQRRSQDRNLHEHLADDCVTRLLDCASESNTAKLWRAKASSYSSSSTETPFLTYFAQTTPDSPARQSRLQACLFLQGSSFYSPQRILSLIQSPEQPRPIQDLLRFEQAILCGKLGRHDDALELLVRGVGDSASAEAYATTGGEVVAAKVALQVGETAGLREWAGLVVGFAPAMSSAGRTANSSAARSVKVSAASASTFVSGGAQSRMTKTVDGETRRELLKSLLRVYMSASSSPAASGSGKDKAAERTTRLLSAQAINLDVVDVIELFPPDWPLSGMSSFLSRSFRRTQHARNEGQIIKAISAGQNKEVVEQSYLVLREQGAVVEELVDGDDGDEMGEGHIDEKTGLDINDDAHSGGRGIVIPPTIGIGEPGTSLGSVKEIRIDSVGEQHDNSTVNGGNINEIEGLHQQGTENFESNLR